jgi:hypothetical protein
MDLGSDLVETYNSIKCLGMVQTSTKADPWFFGVEGSAKTSCRAAWKPVPKNLGSGQVHLPAALYSLAAVLVVVKVNASP